eukprot:4126314-Prymnesium_polylepis.2
MAALPHLAGLLRAGGRQVPLRVFGDGAVGQPGRAPHVRVRGPQARRALQRHAAGGRDGARGVVVWLRARGAAERQGLLEASRFLHALAAQGAAEVRARRPDTASLPVMASLPHTASLSYGLPPSDGTPPP